MPAFMITYDTKNVRNYQNLYDGMAKVGGVRLAESVWGLSTNSTAAQIVAWVKSLLDSDDVIVVVQFQHQGNWAGWKVSSAAAEWLRRNVHP